MPYTGRFNRNLVLCSSPVHQSCGESRSLTLNRVSSRPGVGRCVTLGFYSGENLKGFFLQKFKFMRSNFFAEK